MKNKKDIQENMNIDYVDNCDSEASSDIDDNINEIYNNIIKCILHNYDQLKDYYEDYKIDFDSFFIRQYILEILRYVDRLYKMYNNRNIL